MERAITTLAIILLQLPAGCGRSAPKSPAVPDSPRTGAAIVIDTKHAREDVRSIWSAPGIGTVWPSFTARPLRGTVGFLSPRGLATAGLVPSAMRPRRATTPDVPAGAPIGAPVGTGRMYAVALQTHWYDTMPARLVLLSP